MIVSVFFTNPTFKVRYVALQIRHLKQKTQTITNALEYTILLSKIPIQNTVILYLNGVIVSNLNYTVSNQTVDYTNLGIILEIGDSIEVTYLTKD